MLNEDLKPCPFCGGPPMQLDNSAGNYIWIECKNCAVRTYDYPTAALAIRVWQKRIQVTDVN